MKNVSLEVSQRKETGKKLVSLRERGEVPAVLYGHKVSNLNVSISYNELLKVMKGGESRLIDLVIDRQKPVKVIIQDSQLDPVTGKYIHIDFYKIKMDEKIHITIPLHFVGEVPAVKELNGVLMTNIEEVEASCLPQDLVENIEVDLSGLDTFDAAIHVKDLKLPKNVQVVGHNEDDLVAKVIPPRTEEELEELEEKPKEDVDAVEVEGGAEDKQEDEDSGDDRKNDKKDNIQDKKKEEKK